MSVESPPRPSPVSPLDWLMITGPIGVWVVHVSFEAAITRFTCIEPGWRWVMHAATVVAAAVTAVAILHCLRLARRAGNGEDAGTEAGQMRFAGLFGVAMGLFNLVLVLWEGAYVFFLRSCA